MSTPAQLAQAKAEEARRAARYRMVRTEILRGANGGKLSPEALDFVTRAATNVFEHRPTSKLARSVRRWYAQTYPVIKEVAE